MINETSEAVRVATHKRLYETHLSWDFPTFEEYMKYVESVL